MNDKHTPGPWMLGELSREVMTKRGLAVAAPPEDQGDTEQWAADARLIAAAPDLLEALRRVVASGGLPGANLENALAKAHAAIAKADGASSEHEHCEDHPCPECISNLVDAAEARLGGER